MCLCSHCLTWHTAAAEPLPSMERAVMPVLILPTLPLRMNQEVAYFFKVNSFQQITAGVLCSIHQHTIAWWPAFSLLPCSVNFPAPYTCWFLSTRLLIKFCGCSKSASCSRTSQPWSWKFLLTGNSAHWLLFYLPTHSVSISWLLITPFPRPIFREVKTQQPKLSS